MHRYAAVLALALSLACGSSPPPAMSSDVAAPANRSVENLRAFARLYGYVKYFHPSDEAAAIDWNRFAVLGVSRVIDARDAADLAGRLRELFAPIAPTVEVGVGELPDHANPALHPASTEGLRLVAWQHVGHGRGASGSSPYQSVRLNRAKKASENPEGCLWQQLDRLAVAGKTLRVRARLRSANDDASDVRLALASYEPGADNSIVHDLGPRVAVTKVWSEHQFERTYSPKLLDAYVGVCLLEGGEFQLQGVTLEVAAGDAWKPIALSNSKFDAGAEGWNPPKSPFELSFGKDGDAAHARVGRIAGMEPGALFVAHPKVGDAEVVDLGEGVRARVPLALWSDAEHTLPRADAPPLTKALAAVDVDDPGRQEVGLAAVIVAWNALEHFYPYFDVVAQAWPEELERALGRGLQADDFKSITDNLELLGAALVDGHANINHERIGAWQASLPMLFGWVEGRLLITASHDQRARVGDEVLAIDDEPVADWRERRSARASGARQWKLHKLVRELHYGAKESSVKLRIASPEGSEQTLVLTRNKLTKPLHERPAPHIRKLDGGIYYVDLDRAPWPEIQKVIDELAAAPGVVFDLRGYPNSNHAILNHLIDEPIDTKWMFVPEIHLPDQRNKTFRGFGWPLEPAKPRIAGTAVFLTDGRAISYAESVMGIVHGHRLAAIVGSETAGTNGNVVRTSLPGGYSVMWTGMKVLHHDGARLHDLGFSPTHRAAPTVEGIRAGRDEVLEAGLAVIRETSAR